MSDEILNTICDDVAAMIKRNRPRFGDIVVGDINDGNIELLKKALAGDSRAEQSLVLMVERQHARRREFAAELAAQQG